jgi:Tfp pilus assembly protein PilN
VFIIGLIAVVVGLGANAFYFWTIRHEANQLQTDLYKAEQENRRLSEVKLKYMEREKERTNYKRRVDVIDQLRSNQSRPVELLTMLGHTINQTDEVWLSTMTDEGANISLKGMALSIHGVADLIHNLQRTGYFKSVEIKESYQDGTVKDTQAFAFTVVCEKKPPENTGKKS